MEKEKKLEQLVTSLGGSQGNGILQNELRAEPNKEEMGSNLGKFKDVESLVKAYENLQSDYTKKCQTLSSLEKEVEDNKSKILPEAEKIRTWQESVKTFLLNNPEAEEFTEELAKLICEDEQLAKSSNPLDKAWGEFRQKNFKSKKALSLDEDFLQNYIFNNQRIKEKIVKDYFSSISLEKSPNLILTRGGAKTLVTPPTKPKSISDATKLVEDMFN